MAQSLISIITLATLALASPLAKRQPAGCVEEWTSQAGDTCDSIGGLFGIPGSAVLSANEFLNCNDIWVDTPVCIPYSGGFRSNPGTSSCSFKITSVAGDTCTSLGSTYGFMGYEIWFSNQFLNCNDIWTGTPICVPSRFDVPVTTSQEYAIIPPTCAMGWTSKAGDTCDSIGAIFGFTGDEILSVNTFLNCADIWVNTPICIPHYPFSSLVSPVSSLVQAPPSAQPTTTTPSACQTTYTSIAGDTCDSIGATFGFTGSDIWSSNQFLTCTDIWPWTPVCIPIAPVLELPPTPVAPIVDLPTVTSITSDVVPTDSTTISDVYDVDSTTVTDVYPTD